LRSPHSPHGQNCKKFFYAASVGKPKQKRLLYTESHSYENDCFVLETLEGLANGLRGWLSSNLSSNDLSASDHCSAGNDDDQDNFAL